mmetsp:Transcript_61122/g.138260  ORF Transcript_61122/g.138260 Transcript_61122/m.138260 type:complete len:229 (-) Transcript_61122:836-1522(-)
MAHSRRRLGQRWGVLAAPDVGGGGLPERLRVRVGGPPHSEQLAQVTARRRRRPGLDPCAGCHEVVGGGGEVELLLLLGSELALQLPQAVPLALGVHPAGQRPGGGEGAVVVVVIVVAEGGLGVVGVLVEWAVEADVDGARLIDEQVVQVVLGEVLLERHAVHLDDEVALPHPGVSSCGPQLGAGHHQAARGDPPRVRVVEAVERDPDGPRAEADPEGRRQGHGRPVPR